MVEAIRQGDIPGVQLRCRQRLAVPADRAWKWLTTPELLVRWAADRAEVRQEAGASLLLERAGVEAAPVRELGDTLELSAPRRWSLAFRRLDSGWQAATRLTLALTDTADGCELDIFHEGFEHLSLSSCLTVWEEYRRRWREAASRLADEIVDS